MVVDGVWRNATRFSVSNELYCVKIVSAATQGDDRGNDNHHLKSEEHGA